MKITQVPKTMEYFLSHISEGKLQFLKYEDFPTVIKTPARREQAETRRKDIEMQLSGSKYGIAYTEKNGTNKVRRLISTSDAQNKNFIQVENMINDPNYALIELEI